MAQFNEHTTDLNQYEMHLSMVNIPEYGRFIWYLGGHWVKGVKPPEPKSKITLRLPRSLMEEREKVFNELKNRYGGRTVHSLGELDRETYALGLRMVLETAEAQAVVEQRKLDELNINWTL
ncbi:MAG: hypothetical protein NWE89_16370 [Candidatus Bathyarchaeota archaeon]|nr:hypothetical protein [Candidatus Bathyarchaeota archaeon]